MPQIVSSLADNSDIFRVVNYAPIEHLLYMCHSWWSSYEDRHMFIVQLADLLKQQFQKKKFYNITLGDKNLGPLLLNILHL